MQPMQHNIIKIKDSLNLVIGTVSILGKDDDRPGVDLYSLVELLPSHVPHAWTREQEETNTNKMDPYHREFSHYYW